ncbi:MAG: sensor histidine kinase [Steroidobacteraceae bacterium]|nr:sensor histidine kinase [Steroidobacteraceae bacterium]
MSERPARHAATPGAQMSPWRDMAIVFGITLVSALLAARFELNELLFEHTRQWEHFQLDEWPTALLVLAASLGWLSWRRYQQTLIELRARQRAEERLERVLAENRELAHQHLRIQEAERKHLARELHDELGQYLNAIKLDAVTIGEMAVQDPAGTGVAAKRIVQAVNHVHGVVNDMIRRLRPTGLDELGLVAALESCVDQWQQRLPNVRFSFSVEGNVDDLGELLNLTLYRLIQEGLTNAYKHAQPRNIDITLRREKNATGGDDIVLTLTDDGRGADLARRNAGFGLTGMRERVAMMGGGFAIDTAPERGFGFEARLPVAAGSG